ncbi:hypothetical protein MTR67_051411 [Solanum verrucosum]|uniref:AP2/ERF domain-containing protein n=1 Tax=Solanum verrucosum TaxID=315347 RepID=A0AAF0V772_SOLVR|nr:hypothetical protein MTR67_051411 [Solanum verrucosum]
MKGVMRFGKKGKVSPRYIDPYRISKRVGNVAYELELLQELAAVHPVFHISMLKKCMDDPSLIIPTEDIGIKDSLSYEEIHVQILDRQVRKLRTKEVALVKVLWRNQFVEEATLEAEEDMKKRYPHLFEAREIPDQVFSNGKEKYDDVAATATAVAVPPNEVRYKGVRKRPWGTYGTDITNHIKKVRVWFGTFKTEEEAARAFDTAERMYHGLKAKLYFPPTNEDNLENANNIET